MKIRIYYEDTDCGGIVYHANYLKFCERARSDIFFSQNKMPYNQNFGFVVKAIKADFHKSAKLGDLIEVRTKILEIKKVTLLLLQEIYLKEERLFSMEVKLAFIDLLSAKLALIPKEIMEVLYANN